MLKISKGIGSPVHACQHLATVQLAAQVRS